jgi:pimeloyl-ACP methyl ester carboxylesterase
LACGPWSYQDTIAAEAKSHAVYAVTLAGFDGVPIGATPSLGAAEASLVTLIAIEKLDRPVLIGHSLGGTLAMRFGEDRPDLVRGIVSVDGLTISPLLPLDAAPAERAAGAQRFTTFVANQDPAAFAAGAAKVMNDYVTDPALAKHAAALAARSDQQAVARYGGELQSTDLRPGLSKLTVPLLFVAPIPGLPLPSYMPASMASLSDEQRLGATLGFYTPLLTGAPNLKIVPISNSRHFVMLDQPAAFRAALDSFVATLR